MLHAPEKKGLLEAGGLLLTTPQEPHVTTKLQRKKVLKRCLFIGQCTNLSAGCKPRAS